MDLPSYSYDTLNLWPLIVGVLLWHRGLVNAQVKARFRVSSVTSLADTSLPLGVRDCEDG